MIDLSEVKPGQELFVVSGRGKHRRESMAVVSKVGRKYVYLDGYRTPVDIRTGRSWHGDWGNAHSNGYGFITYFCKQDWQREQQEECSREQFRTCFCDYSTMARQLPIGAINRIMEVLGDVEWEGGGYDIPLDRVATE